MAVSSMYHEGVSGYGRFDMISVLYVDDEEPLLALTKRYLESKGDFLVDTAESGALALQKLKKADYDAVVSDYQMPGMNGIEFLSLLRKEYPHLPFIIFTGKGREEVVIEAFEKGADFYLQKGGDTKPQYAELMRKIQSAVSHRHDETALRESEERFRLSFELASIGKSLTAIDGKLFKVNRAFCEMLGYSKEELYEKGYADITHPDDLAESRECVRALLAGKLPVCRLEKRYIRKDGTSIWTDVSTILLRDTTGNPRFFVTDIMDINERKRAEEALRKSEERFASVFRSGPSAITISRVQDGMFIDVNEAACQLFGYTREQMLGHTSIELGITSRDIRRKVIDDLLARGSVQNIEASITTGTGGKRDVINSMEMIDIGGERCLVTTFNDVTERKRAEEEASTARQWLGMALRAAHAGIWDWDIPTETLTWSPEFFELFGLPPGSPPSFETWLATLHPDDREPAMANIDQSVREHSYLWNEYRIILPGDEVRWIGAGGSTTYNDSGEPLRMNGICIDITERKRMEKALRESEERYRELFSNMSSGVAVYMPVDDGADFIFRDMNRAAEMIDHVRKDEIFGQSVLAAFPGIKEFGLFEVFQRVAHTGAAESHPVSLYRDDRISGWRENFVYKLPSGEIVAIYKDVTEQKQAEVALQESEKKFRTLLDNIPDLVLVHRDGNIIYVNPALTEIMGTTPDEVLNTPIFNYVAPEYSSTVSASLRSRTAAGPPAPYEIEVLTKTGERRTVVVRPTMIEFGGLPAIMTVLTDITDRKKAETALHDTVLRWQSTFDSTQDAICVVDADQQIVMCNRMMQEMVGAENRDDLNGKHCYEMVHKTAEPVPGCPFVRMRQSLRREHLELKIGDRWFVVTTDPVLDETRTLVGAVHNVRDITYRKKTEEALQESEEKFRTLAESCPFAIAIYQGDYWVYTNPAGEVISGYSADELATMHYWDFVAPEFRQSVKEAGKKRQAGGSVAKSYDFKIIAGDGSEKWVALSASPIMYEGKPAGLITVLDITERKRIETELQKSEKMYHTLMDQMPELLVVHRQGVIQYANPAAMKTLGYAPEEVLQRPVTDFIAPEYHDRVRAAIYQRLKGETIEPYEIGLIEKNGGRRTVIVSGRQIELHGSPAILNVLTDITERKLIDEALQQSNKKLNLLSSITRHDILNGIAVLEGYIDLSGDEAKSPGMVEYLGHMDEAVKTIRHQIEFTREYQEIGVKEATWQDVGDTLQKAGSAFKMENVTLTIHCRNYEIFADPLLRKVFYNLFDNAFRYAPPFTTITLSCTETDGELSVVFSDDGAGIAPEMREHLFERGFGNHTGLGLFLSREILAITGITITENGKPGKGARFEMTVPKGKFRLSGEEKT